MRPYLSFALAMALLAGACGNNERPAADASIPDAGSALPDAATDDAGTPTVDASIEDAGESNGLPATNRDDLAVLVDDLEIEIEAGFGGRIAFDVPDDAISVVVSVIGESGRFYTLAEWKNGDGESLVPNGWLANDAGAPSLCTGCPNRIASSEASFAAMLPNGGAAELVPGVHNISVYAYAQSGFAVSPLQSGTALVRVIAKRAPAPPSAGVLDINFHLTGAAGLTADTVGSDEDFQAMLTELEELYAPINIELGTITYTDIPEEFRVIESVIVPRSDLQEMFALSKNEPRAALNVFVVEELMTGIGNFGVLLGVSGGIPGPPMAATLRSGVAIATKRTDDVRTAMSKVLGHEMGHHLGLFHTSEQSFGGPQLHDPIADTPENDASFLMFNSGEGATISVTQGRVMRLNPWVRHNEGGQ